MSEKYNFPRQVRLLKQSQFQDVLATRQSLPEKYYVLYSHPNGLTYPRLGIVVAKSKCRLAVLRNRIKRQVRESFRHCQSKLPNCDIVLVARRGASEAGKCELRQCLDSLFLKYITGPTG